MALFHRSDVVAVQLDEEATAWGYGYLRDFSQWQDLYEVQFPGGPALLVQAAHIREDERFTDEGSGAEPTPVQTVAEVTAVIGTPAEFDSARRAQGKLRDILDCSWMLVARPGEFAELDTARLVDNAWQVPLRIHSCNPHPARMTDLIAELTVEVTEILAGEHGPGVTAAVLTPTPAA